MFGLTIIRKKKLEFLSELINRLNKRVDNLLDEREEKFKSTASRLEHLKNRVEQLKKDYDLELVKYKNEAERNGFASLKDLCILKHISCDCEHCKIESNSCKKLIFHNQTICVTDKANVNSFPKHKKNENQ